MNIQHATAESPRLKSDRWSWQDWPTCMCLAYVIFSHDKAGTLRPQLACVATAALDGFSPSRARQAWQLVQVGVRGLEGAAQVAAGIACRVGTAPGSERVRPPRRA